MRARRKTGGVVWGLELGLLVFLNQVGAQTALEAPAFSDPNLLAAIFTPSKPVRTADEPVTLPSSEFAETRHEFHRNHQRCPIPEDWEAFEKQYRPEGYRDK